MSRREERECYGKIKGEGRCSDSRGNVKSGFQIEGTASDSQGSEGDCQRGYRYSVGRFDTQGGGEGMAAKAGSRGMDSA
jgi:hypothetical protein